MGFVQGVETVDNDYFITEDNIGMLKLAKEANTILVSHASQPAIFHHRHMGPTFSNFPNLSSSITESQLSDWTNAVPP